MSLFERSESARELRNHRLTVEESSNGDSIRIQLVRSAVFAPLLTPLLDEVADRRPDPDGILSHRADTNHRDVEQREVARKFV